MPVQPEIARSLTPLLDNLLRGFKVEMTQRTTAVPTNWERIKAKLSELAESGHLSRYNIEDIFYDLKGGPQFRENFQLEVLRYLSVNHFQAFKKATGYTEPRK